MDSVNDDLPRSEDSNPDLHERARRRIALSGAGEAASAEDAWLMAHLDSCTGCREFADNARERIRSLRGVPVTAGASVVTATRARVRARALELQHQQERFWITCACCAAVTLCSAVTTAVLWRGLAWFGEQASSQPWMFWAGRMSAPEWESAFVVFSFGPAVLAGVFLLARGTFLSDRHRSLQD